MDGRGKLPCLGCGGPRDPEYAKDHPCLCCGSLGTYPKRRMVQPKTNEDEDCGGDLPADDEPANPHIGSTPDSFIATLPADEQEAIEREATKRAQAFVARPKRQPKPKAHAAPKKPAQPKPDPTAAKTNTRSMFLSALF